MTQPFLQLSRLKGWRTFYRRSHKNLSSRHFAKKSFDKADEITKAIKKKHAIQKIDRDKSNFEYKTHSTIKNPSEYQHVKRDLRKCNKAQDIMNIIAANKECPDVQVGTLAIKSIKILTEKKIISREKAMKYVDDIWEIMNEHVVGMDAAAYNEYMHFCDLSRYSKKADQKFNEMCQNGITPNVITLNILLRNCRESADIDLAQKYWKKIVTDLEVKEDAQAWALLIVICAPQRKVALAEKIYAECPEEYKRTYVVSSKMMHIYTYAGKIDKVLEMKNYMDDNNIEIDTRIWNSVIYAHRRVKQFDKAVQIIEEAMKTNEWNWNNWITINHLFEAKIEMLKRTKDADERREILEYIEVDIINHFDLVEAGTNNKLQNGNFGARMLDAYIAAYSPGFGPNLFRECCEKYNFRYWEDIESKIPTLDLLACGENMARAVLEYVFEYEIDKFRNTGLYMFVSSHPIYVEQFDLVNAEDVQRILSEMPTSLTAKKKDRHLLFISSEQTKGYKHHKEDEEDLF